jgi:hypothetical protein
MNGWDSMTQHKSIIRSYYFKAVKLDSAGFKVNIVKIACINNFQREP